MSYKKDEISFEYWKSNRIRVENKSFICNHNGYIYGDNMDVDDIIFVYMSQNEVKCFPAKSHKKNDVKKAYFSVVQEACTKSKTTLNNFLDKNSSQKFRIYTEYEKNNILTAQNINSTNLYLDCSIKINNQTYYVANNLKWCEYFENLSNKIKKEDLNKWFIQIGFDDNKNRRNEITDRDEEENIVFHNKRAGFKISIEEDIQNKQSTAKNKNNNKNVNRKGIKIDWAEINRRKMNVGKLGELIVLEYEKQRLHDLGRDDLVEKIEHSSKIKGDGLGYDIKSYSAEGKELYIEVKATKNNWPYNFFLTQNEMAFANKNSQDFKIYRLYAIDTKAETAKLKMSSSPFDKGNYDIQITSWKILNKIN